MSAYQMYLDPSLEQAVLQGALSLKEAWLLQDEMLQQDSPLLVLPEEYLPLVVRWDLVTWEYEEGRALQ